MEQNLPIVAKKFWSIVRALYFMLRKGISKEKLLSDLNTMMKRGKLAGKAAMHNLMFHHAAAAGRRAHHDTTLSYPVPLNEYEFSCSNTPVHHPTFRLPFHLSKHKTPAPAALQIIASPALPGFGQSPLVRQLRITDSPFPLNVDGDSHVDEAAEEFIMRFYNDLKRQNTVYNLGYS